MHALPLAARMPFFLVHVFAVPRDVGRYVVRGRIRALSDTPTESFKIRQTDAFPVIPYTGAIGCNRSRCVDNEATRHGLLEKHANLDRLMVLPDHIARDLDTGENFGCRRYPSALSSYWF
jgi:hypothetical protein